MSIAKIDNNNNEIYNRTYHILGYADEEIVLWIKIYLMAGE